MTYIIIMNLIDALIPTSQKSRTGHIFSSSHAKYMT